MMTILLGYQITVEKAVLEQAISHYELQGEYVLPGTRDRYPTSKESGRIFGKAVAGQLSSIISSMGRWRLRLEVPHAEVAEMLPLARLLSRSTDPAVRSRSKVISCCFSHFSFGSHVQIISFKTCSCYQVKMENIIPDVVCSTYSSTVDVMACFYSE